MAYNSHNKFVASWENQLDQYRNEFTKKDNAARAKAQINAAELQAALPTMKNPWDSLVKQILESMPPIRDTWRVAGRGMILSAFIGLMKEEPTPGIANAWFQRQAEDIKKEAERVDSKTKEFSSNFDTIIRENKNWMTEGELLVQDQGILLGKMDEIEALYKQAGFYFADMQQAKAIDQQNAMAFNQALMFTSMSLNQMNYQQQMINTLNKPRTCTVFQNTITCR